MKTVNLITGKNTILITNEFISELSEKSQKILKQGIRYIEAESVIEEISDALIYLKEHSDGIDYFRLRLLESGIITTYGLVFNTGLNLSANKILKDENSKVFHDWLMELRNNYYCHSGLYISSSFNQILVTKERLILSASQSMRIRALNNNVIKQFLSHIDLLKKRMQICMVKAEIALSKSLSDEDKFVITKHMNVKDNDKLNHHLNQQRNLLKNYMQKK